MTSNRIAALFSLTLFASAAIADRVDTVVVTNGAGAPVPVLVTNPQVVAPPSPKSVFTDVFANTTVTVMAAPGTGKRFIVKHFSMYMASNNSGVQLTDANCLVSLHQGSVSFTVGTFSLQHADVVGALGVSQDDYLVLGPTDSLDMICLSNPSNSSGRVTVSGDVLSGQ